MRGLDTLPKAITLAALVLGAGCIPLPFASPPVKIRAGGGRTIEEKADTPERSGLIFDLTAGAYPFQLLDAPLERRLDVGAGYRFQLPEHGRSRHGGFLEGAYHFRLNEAGSARALVHVSGDLMTRGDALGGGGSIGGGIEYAGFFSTPVKDEDGESAFYGYAHGEGAIGLDVNAAVYYFEDGPDVSITLGATFRLPAAAGLYLFWLGSDR